MLLALISLGLAFAGVALFLAGTVGLLRFPDVYTRLHALTKVDTLGLGLICLACGIYWGGWLIALKLVLIWLLMMAASSLQAHLIARYARANGVVAREAE